MIVPPAPTPRRGVILLVVITLLTLFAVVGVTFVIFAQAEAAAARVYREAEDMDRADMDPEMLLAYFLSQLVYDTDRPKSALRGHSLARNLYGAPGGTNPASGSGRIHTAGDDEFYNINYTQFGAAAPNPDDVSKYGSPAVAYTYADLNNVYLAAVKADGTVLAPSYHRPNSGGNPANRRHVLRPLPADHAGFPAMEDAGGDVKNLADSPGYQLPNTNPPQYANNDSVWLDLDFPVMRGPDGRRFKPLFAPLVTDLDNRVNVNTAGFWFLNPQNGTVNLPAANSNWGGQESPPNVFTCNQGWGPWETRIDLVVNGASEAANLFRGANGVSGRYDMNFWGRSSFRIRRGPSGHFYNYTDFDGPYQDPHQGRNYFNLPSGTNCFPSVGYGYHNGFPHPWSCEELYSHARLYNYFSPTQNTMSSGGSQQRDSRFGVSNLEALLRYGDRGSPALGSDLFKLCPTSFSNARTRRLVTTHSFDITRPGLPPLIWDPTAQPYELAANSLYPTGNAPAAPQAGAAVPSGSEFSADWRSLAGALNRIDLNRTLADFPDRYSTTTRYAGAEIDTYNTALAERQQLAQEVFDALRLVTGAAQGNAAQKDALRWLGQLAVNIVDFIDTDDYMTPFAWNKPDPSNRSTWEWVFGTELPRCVVNEVYADIVNHPDDQPANVMMATKPYQVRFWVELHNPMRDIWDSNTVDSGLPGPRMQGYDGGNHAMRLSEYAKARLQMPAAGGDAAYSCYQICIATAPNANIRGASNVGGEAEAANVKLVVSDFVPEDGTTPPVTGDDVNKVWPASVGASGPGDTVPAGVTAGFYVLGPKDDFPGNQFQPTLRVKDNGQPTGAQKSAMAYTIPIDQFPIDARPHAVLLRRLACPYLPPQDNPADTTRPYNPYITVDYVNSVPTNDRVVVTNTARRNLAADHPANDVTKAASQGRRQPYAADKQAAQTKAQTGAPKHTFLITGQSAHNEPRENSYQWLAFNDRPVAGVHDLLHVSGFKPHELTQQFMTGAAQFAHEAPWFQANSRIYRVLECLEGGYRFQWSPVGGRHTGRINLNTVWDPETFQALCGARTLNNYAISFFNATDVTNIFNKLTASRTPTGQPGANDKPFQPGCGSLEDSFLRSDPNNAGTPLFHVPPSVNPAGTHPWFKNAMLRRLASNVTTRSNVFGVWLTVGFFEVVSDNDPNRPPQLGAEIGRSENRHIRHRMFAVIDRSSLTVGLNAQNQPQPGSVGPAPFFLEADTAAKATGAEETIYVPAVSGTYEDASWNISTGMKLVVDAGQNQEVVLVKAAGQDGTGYYFRAVFTKPHPIGFAVSNAMLGNPGPQPLLDPRNPTFAQVIRYMSIIE